MIVVDGVEGKEYDELLGGTRCVFDSARTFHTVLIRQKEFLRVEVEILEE